MPVYRPTTALFTALVLSAASTVCPAQPSATELSAFTQWANRSLHAVTHDDLNAPLADLQPLDAMIGDATIVALSEGQHSGAEGLAFRNRMFRYLVEELGFAAIAIESGLVESQALNDYVTLRTDDYEWAVTQGFSHSFEYFQQNRELIRWLRNYNAGLPEGKPKLQVFGLDVSGSPGNLGATRKPDTALQTVLAYLEKVDPATAVDFNQRLARYLPVLASTNDYGLLSAEDRGLLTSTIEDLISLIERRQFTYVPLSSLAEYRWAERAAVGARQIDSWFRRMPDNWVLADGLAWTSESQMIRDRVMADNLDWVLDQLQDNDKVFVFASVGHIAKTPWRNADWWDLDIALLESAVPLGAYAQARHGADYLAILNVIMEGSVYFCGATNPNPMTVQTPDANWAEALFATADTSPYLLDLRTAPANVSTLLRQPRDHRNGHFATLAAFDIVYFDPKVTSDCI